MPIDIFEDEPQAPVTPAPVPVPAPAPAPQPKRFDGSGVLAFICGAALAGLLLFCIFPRVSPTPDDGDDVRPTPAVEGLHVMVLDESGERHSWTKEQAQIFTSIPLRQWLAENCAKEGNQPAYRFPDKDDRLDAETPVWREMKGMFTLPPPAVIARIGKKAIEFKPTSAEQIQERLAKFKSDGK